jgi:hypothetical protein
LPGEECIGGDDDAAGALLCRFGKGALGCPDGAKYQRKQQRCRT